MVGEETTATPPALRSAAESCSLQSGGGILPSGRSGHSSPAGPGCSSSSPIATGVPPALPGWIPCSMWDRLGCCHTPQPPFTSPPHHTMPLWSQPKGQTATHDPNVMAQHGQGCLGTAQAAASCASLQPDMPEHILQLLGAVGSCWSSWEIHGCTAPSGACSAPQHPPAFEGACTARGPLLCGLCHLGACPHLLVPHSTPHPCPCCPSLRCPRCPGSLGGGAAGHAPPALGQG